MKNTDIDEWLLDNEIDPLSVIENKKGEAVFIHDLLEQHLKEQLETINMSKLKNIKIWYRFRPSIDIWFSKTKIKTHFVEMPNQTWYGGEWFNTGYFALIQCHIFSIHIMFKWWKLKKI